MLMMLGPGAFFCEGGQLMLMMPAAVLWFGLGMRAAVCDLCQGGRADAHVAGGCSVIWVGEGQLMLMMLAAVP